MGQIADLVQQVMAAEAAPVLKKETSPEMSTFASKYLKISKAKWAALDINEQIKIVRSLAAGQLSQDETKGQGDGAASE